MDYFNYNNRELYCEDVPAAELAAALGGSDPLLQLSAGDTEDDLHDQRD